MAYRKDEAIELELKCAKCHHKEPLMRKVHLLRMMDQGVDSSGIHSHLFKEFGKKGEDDGFIKSEMVGLSYIREHYHEPTNMPAWMNWLENKADVSRTATGWRIIPR